MSTFSHFAYVCNNDLSNLPPESCAILACSCKLAAQQIEVLSYQKKINYLWDEEDARSMAVKKRIVTNLLNYQRVKQRNDSRSQPVGIDTVNYAIDKLSFECNPSKAILTMLLESLSAEDCEKVNWELLKEKDLAFSKKMRGRFEIHTR